MILKTFLKFNNNPNLDWFLLLELMDSIWINEVYKPHMKTLVDFFKIDAYEVHSLERFEEL